MGMSGLRSKKYHDGSVIAIPIPDGKFAFAKVFKDFEFGVYDFVAKEIKPLEDVTKHSIAFFQATTDALDQVGCLAHYRRGTISRRGARVGSAQGDGCHARPPDQSPCAPDHGEGCH